MLKMEEAIQSPYLSTAPNHQFIINQMPVSGFKQVKLSPLEILFQSTVYICLLRK
jgi:hypothetical protein